MCFLRFQVMLCIMYFEIPLFCNLSALENTYYNLHIWLQRHFSAKPFIFSTELALMFEGVGSYLVHISPANFSFVCVCVWARTHAHMHNTIFFKFWISLLYEYRDSFKIKEKDISKKKQTAQYLVSFFR